ncbi:30S ribosomal protein S15 [bacterium]|nr:MAG: 30S ribosomal protein S15 [bacterium]QQR61519.1 MAG: 30S ribosomal protein S15 [bacterium]QQR62953.1 MAG: 30S ribosomal protein S15 [bacterium]
MLKNEKQGLIAEYAKHAQDSGSSAVQIAIITKRIVELTEHCKKHKKDFSTKRGLQKLVAQRRSLLTYVARKNSVEYKTLLQKLGIRR